jgi:hypothetical protein
VNPEHSSCACTLSTTSPCLRRLAIAVSRVVTFLATMVLPRSSYWSFRFRSKFEVLGHQIDESDHKRQEKGNALRGRNQGKRKWVRLLGNLVRPARLERATSWFVG